MGNLTVGGELGSIVVVFTSTSVRERDYQQNVISANLEREQVLNQFHRLLGLNGWLTSRLTKICGVHRLWRRSIFLWRRCALRPHLLSHDDPVGGRQAEIRINLLLSPDQQNLCVCLILRLCSATLVRLSSISKKQLFSEQRDVCTHGSFGTARKGEPSTAEVVAIQSSHLSTSFVSQYSPKFGPYSIPTYKLLINSTF
jgi:hypothetical protein